MSDKGYRALENSLIRKVDHEKQHGKVIVAPVHREPIVTKPKTQVERY